MSIKKIIKEIKNIKWENRVQRPGFLQSKLIVTESLKQNVYLTKGVSICEKSNMWVKNSALYNNDTYNLLVNKIFPRAFNQDKKWPLKILRELEHAARQTKKLVYLLQSTNWDNVNTQKKLSAFKKYVYFLKNVQKYYTIAVPLTNYCENELIRQNATFSEYAVQYKSLDVDRMGKSLYGIKTVLKKGSRTRAEKLIKKHLIKFAWIKSNYNLFESYTREDVLSEVKTITSPVTHKKPPKSGHRHLIIGLQIGIFLRNRMKELSQQLWFAYEGLARSMANDLKLTRENFLQLSSQEVLYSFKKKRLIVNSKVLLERQKGFITGTINGKSIIVIGPEVEHLFKLYNPTTVEKTSQVTGMVACKGFVKNKVRVIHTVSEINKLKQGEILITTMTTPDFVVALKRAGAIVTDEGGLSCHAAIVSRELDIPCIIGTKIATKVYKDGDVVEVDANIGIVKLMK